MNSVDLVDCPICGDSLPVVRDYFEEFMVPYCGACARQGANEARLSQWYAIGYHIGKWTHTPETVGEYQEAFNLGLKDRLGDLNGTD